MTAEIIRDKVIHNVAAAAIRVTALTSVRKFNPFAGSLRIRGIGTPWNNPALEP